MKKFYCYRYQPRGSVRDYQTWVYAADNQEAQEKVRARLNEDYGSGGYEFSNSRVKVYTKAEEANNQSRNGILSALSPEDVREFLADRRAEQPPPCPPPPRKSTLDIESEKFEQRLAREEALVISGETLPQSVAR